MENKVSELRNNKFRSIEKRPGFYRWWFKEDVAFTLIQEMNRWLPEKDRFLIKDFCGEKYIALYIGISKDMKGRIKWHTCQKHTFSNVNRGFLSTLRQTLSALLKIQMSVSYEEVNRLIDDNCIWEWSYSNSFEDAHQVELQVLSQNYCYPLNVKDNKTICKDALNWLKQQRAKYRH